MLAIRAVASATLSDSRNSRLPLPADHWWFRRAREAMKTWAAERPGGVRREPGWVELHEDVMRLAKVPGEPDPGIGVDAIRRCVSGAFPTWETTRAISAVLGIPSPAYIAEDESHAAALGDARHLAAFKSAVEDLQSLERAARSRKIAVENDQSERVGSSDGLRRGAAGRRSGAG